MFGVAFFFKKDNSLRKHLTKPVSCLKLMKYSSDQKRSWIIWKLKLAWFFKNLKDITIFCRHLWLFQLYLIYHGFSKDFACNQSCKQFTKTLCFKLRQEKFPLIFDWMLSIFMLNHFLTCNQLTSFLNEASIRKVDYRK